jgi:nucleoside-diphosphate-sugar epimerase
VLEFDLKNNATQDLRIPNNPVLNSLLLDVDFVYFLAFDIGGSKFLANNQDNFDFIQNNLKILTNTFDLLNQTGIPFIFSSTQMSAMTHSNYGLTKLLGEKLTSSLGGVTVKFWNVYGAEPISEKSHVVADFIYSAQNNNSIVMLTDGKESRQMLHVDDCSNALYILSQHYATLPRDKEYHITSFSWVTVQEIANTVAGFFPGCKVIPGHATDVVQQDLQKQPDLHILTYWQPQISLETGVRSLI